MQLPAETQELETKTKRPKQKTAKYVNLLCVCFVPLGCRINMKNLVKFMQK